MDKKKLSLKNHKKYFLNQKFPFSTENQLFFYKNTQNGQHLNVSQQLFVVGGVFVVVPLA